MSGWFDLFAAAFLGALAVKLLDFFYDQYRQRADDSRSAKKLINKHLDPILKSADELVGKIYSLAKSDFKGIRKTFSSAELSNEESIPRLNILYLFGHFWCWTQILRIEGVYVNLSSTEKGEHLLLFLKALEASKTQLLDRAWQRGIGEALIDRRDTRLRAITFYDFVISYRNSPELQEWFKPIISIFNSIGEPSTKRQRILVYGTILHALTDHLDKQRLVTREIPTCPNKLTDRKRNDLRFRIFPIYLHFVKYAERYYRK